MAERTRAHVLITGTVQGVFYRVRTREAARQRRVAGWVQNLPDGRVEAVFEGDRAAVEEMIRWCETGSPRAVVEDVTVTTDSPQGITGFEIRR